MRETYVGRDVQAGCFECYGYDARWFGPNAQGVAARHHDATGHNTWADVVMTVRYGKPSGLTCVRADGCAGANVDAESIVGAAAAQLGR